MGLRLRALLEEQAGTRQQLAVGLEERGRLEAALQHAAARGEAGLGELGEAKLTLTLTLTLTLILTLTLPLTLTR